ncbi:hypothetical protein [Paenibacillus paridis]|jgi:hypothetical protein|nr:hypothetical protein [Paenibacillus paridis]
MKEELKTTTNSMAPTEQEMIKLGEDMEKMDTNAEVIEKGLIPDPVQ